jgi:hypothetical protein
MPDPAEQLQHLHQAGFEFQTFERFPRAIGVIRGNCIVLMTATPEGLTMLGTPGWRMGEVLGVLTTRGKKQVFQAKEQLLEATAERLDELSAFRKAIEDALKAA